MTSLNNFLVLLNDLTDLVDTQEFPEAERLIMNAREALDADSSTAFIVRSTNNEFDPNSVMQ